ncbi:MAG TPA: hypothetical protein VHB49_09275 [Bradyrhizobium sp.]|nr:hypothetical protein [Bradyrhizobium sp.]
MTSIIHIFFVVAVSVMAVSLSRPAMANDLAATDRDGLSATLTPGPVRSPKPVVRTFRGVVASVNESNDTIKIRRSPEATEELKLQDGLLLDAVRYGDHVEVIVEDINGAQTIVGLIRE